MDENIAISRHEFFYCSQLIGIYTRNFERRAHGAKSSRKLGQFHCSRERRSEVNVNLPDFRRFTVIGLAAERNVALG